MNSMFSLVQLLTYDNVDQTARTSMFGCLYSTALGSSFQTSDLPKYDHLCQSNGVGVGWIAPIYFMLFVIICGFIMMSSLIGLMISCLEQYTDIRNAEIEIWKDVDQIAIDYSITKASVKLSLKLFESIDKEEKCHLTYRDLQPLMKMAGFETDQEHLQYFLQVDRDGSGQIEFPEFLELLSILGYSLGKTALAKKTKVLEANLDKLNSMIDDIFEREDSVSLGRHRGMQMPATVVDLSLEKEHHGSVMQAVKKGYAAPAIVRPNRSALERASYRHQSKKVDLDRLKASFSQEQDDRVDLGAIRDYVNNRYGPPAEKGIIIRSANESINAIRQFEDKVVENPSKPRSVILNYSKMNTKVVPSMEMVLQDTE